MMRIAEITSKESWVGLGIAGNQADHLNQAGEATDFTEVESLENAPKGMFPWLLPNSDSFLNINPISSEIVRLRGEKCVQPEPEIALIVEFYFSEEGDLSALSVRGFTAFNDYSRRENEPKISLKKNWGTSSQGMATDMILINDFTSPTGRINSYRLACYLRRGGELISYGEDTALSDYCYFNQTLVDWMVSQIQTQQDVGPLESLNTMMGRPAFGVIGIGATRYTEYGNSDEKFLKAGDEVIVTTYNSSVYSKEAVAERLNSECVSEESMLVLRQRVEN